VKLIILAVVVVVVAILLSVVMKLIVGGKPATTANLPYPKNNKLLTDMERSCFSSHATVDLSNFSRSDSVIRQMGDRIENMAGSGSDVFGR
jgi:hypothetical protein